MKKKSELIQLIAQELILRKKEITTPIETIYFGGGTPSLLTILEIQFLIRTIYDNYTVVGKPEITLEANPDDLHKEKIIELSKSPINRLSIGIQSFFNEDLQFMKRAHNANEAQKCLAIATQYFDNITIDLIYGTPTLSHENWKKNIQTVLDFGINHISSYALTVESKTLLSQQINSKKIKPLNEQKAQEQFYILKDILKAANFIHYEVSNFAKERYFSKHNSSYWLSKSYLGVGPSAHSFNGKERSWNIANNSNYIKSLKQNELANQKETLSKTDLFNEKIMIGLRTIFGVSLIKIKTEFDSIYFQHLIKESKKHIEKGLLIIENDILKSTEKGLFFIDGIASDLFWVSP